MVETDPIALPPPPDPPEKPMSRDPVSLLVACLAIGGFGAFVMFLLSNLKLDALQWTRATYLLNGVEAIAFAAAGAAFPRSAATGADMSALVRAAEGLFPDAGR